MHFLFSLATAWITLAVALWVADSALSDFEISDGKSGYLKVAAVFGILHVLLGGLLFWLLTFASLGLAYLFSFFTKLFVTAVVLKLASSFTSRLKVGSLLTGIWAALIMTCTTSLLEWVGRGVFH